MSLQTRQVTFSRPTHVQLAAQQPQQTQYQFQPLSQPTQQYQSQPQPTQPASNGLALPYSAPHLPGPTTSLALPGPTATAPPYSSQPRPTQVSQTTQSSSPTLVGPSQSLAGPSTPGPTVVPATPAPLTLEQQHITAVEGIVPTLQNIVATVNLDCRLDLKTIALHARNAEYNPKVCTIRYLLV